MLKNAHEHLEVVALLVRADEQDAHQHNWSLQIRVSTRAQERYLLLVE